MLLIKNIKKTSVKKVGTVSLKLKFLASEISLPLFFAFAAQIAIVSKEIRKLVL